MALHSAQEADLVEKIRVIHQDSIATMPDHRILEELEERRATADPKDIVDQIVLGEYEIAAAHRGLIRNPGAMMNPKRKRGSKAKRNPGAMMNPGLTEVTRAANAGRYLQRYTVTGNGRFPLDMLRYDYSWVHPAEDYRGREPRSHTVYRYVGTKTDREYPTDRRWESFGWTVSDVDYEKVDRPLKMQESFRIAQPVNIGDLGELKAWPASGEDVERINAGEGGVGLRRLTATKADTLDFEVLPENFDGEILELAPYGAQWGNPGKKRLVAGGKVPKGLSKTMAKRKAKAKATAKAKKNPCIGLHFHAKDADELMEAAEKSGKRQGNPKKKLYSKLLITKSHRLWQTYDEKPLKKHLLAFGEHIEVMKASGEAELKEETRNATRAFKAELKKHGWKKPAAKRKSKARKNPIGLGRHGNIYVPAEATAEQIAEILNEDQRIASDVQADGYATTHGLGRKVHNDMLLAGEVPGWKMWEHQYTFQPIHGWPEERSHYRIAPEPESNPRKKKAKRKSKSRARKRNPRVDVAGWEDVSRPQDYGGYYRKEIGGGTWDAEMDWDPDQDYESYEVFVTDEGGNRTWFSYDSDSGGFDEERLLKGVEAEILKLMGLAPGTARTMEEYDEIRFKIRAELPPGKPYEPNPRKKAKRKSTKKKAAKKKTLGGRAKRAGRKIEKRGKVLAVDAERGAEKAGRKLKKYGATKQGYTVAGAGLGAILLGPLGAVAGAMGGSALHDNPGAMMNPTALNEKLRLRLPEMSDKEVVDVYEQYYTMYTKSARPEMDYGEEGVELIRSVIKDTSEEIRRRDLESNPKKKKGSKARRKANPGEVDRYRKYVPALSDDQLVGNYVMYGLALEAAASSSITGAPDFPEWHSENDLGNMRELARREISKRGLKSKYPILELTNEMRTRIMRGDYDVMRLIGEWDGRDPSGRFDQWGEYDNRSNPKKKKGSKLKTKAKKAGRKAKKFAKTKEGYGALGAGAGALLLGPIGAVAGAIGGTKLHGNPGRRKNPTKGQHHALADRKWNMFESSWDSFSISNSPEDLLGAYMAVVQAELHYAHAGIENDEGRGYGPAGAEAEGIRQQISERLGG